MIVRPPRPARHRQARRPRGRQPRTPADKTPPDDRVAPPALHPAVALENRQLDHACQAGGPQRKPLTAASSTTTPSCSVWCTSTSPTPTSRCCPRAAPATRSAPSSETPTTRSIPASCNCSATSAITRRCRFPRRGSRRWSCASSPRTSPSSPPPSSTFNRWFAAVEPYQILEVGRNTSLPLHPAAYWTGIGGETKIDFIGRAEDFERDFARFCHQVGITAFATVNANVTEPPEIAPAQDGPYRYTHLMTAATIQQDRRAVRPGLRPVRLRQAQGRLSRAGAVTPPRPPRPATPPPGDIPGWRCAGLAWSAALAIGLRAALRLPLRPDDGRLPQLRRREQLPGRRGDGRRQLAAARLAPGAGQLLPHGGARPGAAAPRLGRSSSADAGAGGAGLGGESACSARRWRCSAGRPGTGRAPPRSPRRCWCSTSSTIASRTCSSPASPPTASPSC